MRAGYVAYQVPLHPLSNKRSEGGRSVPGPAGRDRVGARNNSAIPDSRFSLKPLDDRWNLLNAVGDHPDIDKPSFIPLYLGTLR
jgi:hypothetical protein